MCTIILVRHGTAILPDQAYRDELRWLTQSGRQDVIHLGQSLFQLGVNCTHIFTSPLVRAVQTAEILGQQLSFQGVIQTHESLAIDIGTTAQALSPIDEADATKTLLFVSHEPKSHKMASFLTQIKDFPSFPTAGACLIRWHKNHGHFLYKISPSYLRPLTNAQDDW